MYQGTPQSVLLNVSYHKKHDCIWLWGGDLIGFKDIRPFRDEGDGACMGMQQGTP